MQQLSPAPEAPGTLYAQVAGQIQRLVLEGTLVPGDRLPSVRDQSRRQGVSITTVLEAYRLLESEGWIEARPQSGYFVCSRVTERPCEPECSRPTLDPTQVSVGELCMRVLKDTANPELVQLGATVPNPEFLPSERLNRIQYELGRKLGSESLAYAVPPGCKELRVQVAKRALAAGCELRPDEIVTTVGCQEAMVLCLKAVCRPGDTVAIESPTYYGMLQAIEALGLQALELPTHPRTGISLDTLRYALEHHPIHACLVSSFNNPTGACMPDEARRELVELLAAHDIPLIEDDIYGDLSHTFPRPRTAKAWDRKGLVMFCSSFSKTLAPGYRIGWVAPGRFFREVEHMKFCHSLSTATLPQLALAEYMASGAYERYLRRVTPVYARQVALVAQAVGRAFPEGTKATRPGGGFSIWVELPAGHDALQLYHRSLQAGITFAPGAIFSPKGAYRNFLRLNASRWNPGIEQAISRLGALAG